MNLAELHWSASAGYPLLASLQLLPALAGVLMLMLRRQARLVFGVALAAAGIELLVALDLYRRYDQAETAMQFGERLDLLGPFAYHAAADGLTVLFVLLTAFLSLLVMLYGRTRPIRPQYRFLALVFLTEASLMGMFTTVDMLWFVLFSIVELIVVGLLLWEWASSPEKDLALSRYLQFMGTGLLLLVVGMLMLGWNYADASGGAWSFNLFDLRQVGVPEQISSLVFFLLFYGLAIRVPLFPLHGWLPVVAEHGTTAIAPVFLLGLKVGIYGLLRYVLPLLPEAVLQWHEFVVAFALAGVFYAATLALMQNNLRRLLAYAVVSHTSVLVIGLFSLDHAAFQGSVMLAVNFGLAGAGLLLMMGLIFNRLRTTLLPQLGGLFDPMPIIGATFLIAGLSIVGMPGTPGFDAAHLVLEAAVHRFGALFTVGAALGNVAAAAFLLWAFQRAFLAPAPEGAKNVAGTTPMERVISVAMIVVLIGAGFFSGPWLDLIETSLLELDSLYAMEH